MSLASSSVKPALRRKPPKHVFFLIFQNENIDDGVLRFLGQFLPPLAEIFLAAERVIGEMAIELLAACLEIESHGFGEFQERANLVELDFLGFHQPLDDLFAFLRVKTALDAGRAVQEPDVVDLLQDAEPLRNARGARASFFLRLQFATSHDRLRPIHFALEEHQPVDSVGRQGGGSLAERIRFFGKPLFAFGAVLQRVGEKIGIVSLLGCSKSARNSSTYISRWVWRRRMCGPSACLHRSNSPSSFAK